MNKILNLFRRLVTKLEMNSSISPYLRFVINPYIERKILWGVEDQLDYISYEILFKPVEYFAITKDNHLIMNDYTINFEKEIEAIYDTYLPDKKIL